MDKPNILFLLSDQHSPRILGCYGDPHVRTPNLDRLAGEGVAFDACYCDNPVCLPSRMAMLTARHGHELEIWGNFDSLDSNVPTMAHGLGIAGYRTVLVGRMHFVGPDQWHGFQERVVGDVTSSFVGMNRSEHRFRGFWGGDTLKNPGEGRSFDLAYDTTVAMEACRIIRDHEVSGDKRPLFLVASFYSPHDPYVMPRPLLEPYLDCDDDAINPDAANVGGFNAAMRRAHHFDQVTPDKRRLARAAYRAKTQFLDGLVGDVLASWQDSSLGAGSLCVYGSDHGEMLGDHGLWMKCSFYDSSVRVPLIFHYPSQLTGGRRIAEPVSLIDLGPTLLDLAGAPPLPGASGRSFWPALRGEDGPWPEVVLSEQAQLGLGGPCRMVRSGPWKYTYYEAHPPQLFNLADDPNELNDRASDPALGELCAKLREQAFADGWNPARVRSVFESRIPNRAYLSQYARAVEPIDPWQWGRPAQL